MLNLKSAGLYLVDVYRYWRKVICKFILLCSPVRLFVMSRVTYVLLMVVRLGQKLVKLCRCTLAAADSYMTKVGMFMRSVKV